MKKKNKIEKDIKTIWMKCKSCNIVYEIETNIPELWIDNTIEWECVCGSKEKKILIQKGGE